MLYIVFNSACPKQKVLSIISSSTRALLFEFNFKVRHTFQNHDGRRCKRGSVALFPLHMFQMYASADFETLVELQSCQYEILEFLL